ncbi:MAG: nucleotidyltransferase family protein [Nitrosopumilaceae archaeon]|nr:nucleotidyltransferase family protein [Nitrosopumilaceae archaeon]
MKAIILSGGSGLRGRPFTKFIPKAMIPCNGKPAIYYIVKHIIHFKLIDEIIIITNLRGLGGQIYNYFHNTKYEERITFIQDSQKGTAGDLNCVSKEKISNPFVLWFADNLCAIDIHKMKSCFDKTNSYVCIATSNKKQEKTGFAKLENNMIKQFEEKPLMKLQLEECLGIYIMNRDVLDMTHKLMWKDNINLSYDVLQKLVKCKNISSFNIENQQWIDVESPAMVAYNTELVTTVTKLMEH